MRDCVGVDGGGGPGARGTAVLRGTMTSVRLVMFVVWFVMLVVVPAVPAVPAVVGWAAVAILAAVTEGDALEGRVISTETQFG